MPAEIIIRDCRRGSFRVDDAFVDSFAAVVGNMATLVYVSLCRHSDKAQEAWPSIEKIGAEMGINSRSVRRGIKSLEEHGIVSVIRGRDIRQRRAVNVYVLIDKNSWHQRTDSPVAPGDGESKSQGTEPGDSSAMEGNTRKETQLKDVFIPVEKSKIDALDKVRADLRLKGFRV